MRVARHATLRGGATKGRGLLRGDVAQAAPVGPLALNTCDPEAKCTAHSQNQFPGTFQYASPLTFDFTEDGRDDVLVVVNAQKAGGPPVGKYVNELRIFDPHARKEYCFREQKTGSNLGSTPLLTDLDGDGYLDVIYSYMEEPGRYFSFTSLTIERMETRIELNGPIKWGEYMGPYRDGVYRGGSPSVVSGSPGEAPNTEIRP